MSTKADAIMNKIGGWTQHGSKRQAVRAKAFTEFAPALEEIQKKYPGMTHLVGMPGQGQFAQLIARKNAYKSEQQGLNNLKAMVPFVGMGRKGQEALERIEKKGSWTRYMGEGNAAAAVINKKMVDRYRVIDKEHPGMALIKGTPGTNVLHNLIAKRQAYVSQLEGMNNLKQLNPFAGMGRKGGEALDKLMAKHKGKSY